MKTLSNVELLKLGIQNSLHEKNSFLVTMLARLPITDGLEKEGVLIRDKQGLRFTLNGETYRVEGDGKKPLFSPDTELTIDSTWSPWIKEKTVTKFGRVISNFILIDSPGLSRYIPFINRRFGVKDIESHITVLLSKEEENITALYENFVNAVSYYRNIALYVNITATPKNILPPPGLQAKRDKLLKEKYGGKIETYEEMAAFEKDLQEIDKEWLREDPSYGKFVSGKIANISRKKLYMTFGAEAGFKESTEARPVIGSLSEGWPKDPKDLVEMFNAARAGSFSRGAETQNGGVVAKIILRATNNLRITIEDCGTNLYFEVLLTEEEAKKYSGRYILDGKELKVLTDALIAKYNGKKVKIRSPLYCNAPKGQYCKVCAGKQLGALEGGAALAGTEISAIILSSSMAAMHGKVLATEEIDLTDAFT